MRIETILNHLEPHKGFVYKGCKLHRESDTLEVMIAERDGSRVSCPVCGKRCPIRPIHPISTAPVGCATTPPVFWNKSSTPTALVPANGPSQAREQGRAAFRHIL